jgi:hypothetical protein
MNQRGSNILSRLAELERRAPRGVVWYLSNGTEFTSHLTTAELVMKGEQQIRSGRLHPIYDAARRTVRSEDGSLFHALLVAVVAPILKRGKHAERRRGRSVGRSCTKHVRPAKGARQARQERS